jgi:hypothetical protein
MWVSPLFETADANIIQRDNDDLLDGLAEYLRPFGKRQVRGCFEQMILLENSGSPSWHRICSEPVLWIG